MRKVIAEIKCDGMYCDCCHQLIEVEYELGYCILFDASLKLNRRLDCWIRSDQCIKSDVTNTGIERFKTDGLLARIAGQKEYNERLNKLVDRNLQIFSSVIGTE